MTEADLLKFMAVKKKTVQPLFVKEVDERFIIAAHQGALSDHDLRVQYKQKKKDGKWSRQRTPKHIHWAVDVLIKLNEQPEQTRRLLDALLRAWAQTEPITSPEIKELLLNAETLLMLPDIEIVNLESLNDVGEYSVKFLVLMAKLLMLQEKTNYSAAYMFKNLLEALRQGEDIFKIVSIASHGGRK